MTTSTGATSLRRARIAVSALFFTNGALTANLLPRYPEIKDRLALDPAAYGVAVASFPAGAIIAGLAAGVLIRRFGSGRMAVAGTLCMSLAVLAAGIAPSVWWFAGFLLVGGALDAITDVAQNAHGLRVQRHVGSSIINSFHAVWSIGAVTGGAMAAVAIALHAPVAVHLGVSAVLFALVSLAALRWCLPGADEPADAVELASGALMTTTRRARGSPPVAQVTSRPTLWRSRPVTLTTAVTATGHATVPLHAVPGAPWS